MTDVCKDKSSMAEPLRFVEYLGEVYRVLLTTDTGSWLIRCMAPAAPVFVCAEELERYSPVPTPESFLAAPGDASAARQKRMDMIAPLVEDRECIISGRKRQDRAKRQAERFDTTSARIVRLYLRYLATGQVMDTWKRPNVERPEFDAAIRKYYFSSKKFSCGPSTRCLCWSRTPAAMAASRRMLQAGSDPLPVKRTEKRLK